MEILKIEKLTKKFGNKVILDNISFSVKKGEILSIIGPSGCGKTTLLMTLIGLYKADSGNIYLDEQNITGEKIDKRKMGIIFQDYSLFENMTVLKNVSYALSFSKDKKIKSTKEEIAKSMLKSLGLENHLNKYPSQLSGGERQRVAIARTLVLNPDILLLDEPLSALDIDSKISLKKLILDIREKYKSTIIYVTHDQEDAFSMADNIIVMNKGKIRQIDTPKDIINNPKDEFIKSFVVDNLLKRKDLLNNLIQTKKDKNEK
ncbi:MAG TPA: ABC transporter ATP-binding protein [Firmicutes bacterium]|nr:ABC transporter ATP-binding protein [Bacillota bacterium]